MPNFYTRHKTRIDKFLLVTALVIFIYIFFTYLFSFFAPFVIGFVFSLILNPLVRLITKRLKLNRGVASGLCLLLLILLLILLSGTIVNKIIIEARLFVYSFPTYVSEMSDFVNEIAIKLELFANVIPEQVWLVIEKADLFAIITSGLGSGVKNGSWSFVTNIPGFFLSLILSFISAFFFIRDRETIFAQVKSHTPSWLIMHISNIKKGLIYALWGYFKAQIIIMSIVSCIIIVGLLIVGYPYALFVGLLIAFIDMLPIFGSGAVFWPWAVYCFVNGNISTGVNLIIINLVVLVTRHSIEPRILGSQIGLHPLLTLMSMFIGLKLFGVVGLIIGPAITISIKVIYESQKTVEKD